jgi:prophage tail gpP-like protein
MSDDHGITDIALKAQSVDELIDTLFLKLLTRKPSAQEHELYTQHLSAGFNTRHSKPQPPSSKPTRAREKYVSWSNHLDGEATTVRMAQEAAARQGEAPTEKLDAQWRTRMEDVLWAMLNAPEWAFSP